MEPRVALDKTIKLHNLNAAQLARDSGVNKQELSRYRRQHKDMGSLSVFKVVDALPLKAKLYFWQLCFFGDAAELHGLVQGTSRAKYNKPNKTSGRQKPE